MSRLDDIRARIKRDGEPIPEPHALSTAIARLLQSRDDRRHLLDLLAERDAQIAAVRELHKPEVEHAITGDCANEGCDHEDACPTVEVRVCRECWSVAEWVSPYFAENGLSLVTWPCPTILALDAKGGAS